MEKKLKVMTLAPHEHLCEGIHNRKRMAKEEILDQFPDNPERSKREDYPDGSMWQNCSSLDKNSKTYEFYGRLKGKWVFLGRFKHFLDVEWDRCGALNTVETQ